MLSDFITANRSEIIARCRDRVSARVAPHPTEHELEHGIPLFLDQLAAALATKSVTPVGAGATKHGSDLLREGFTVAQVVHDYGDVCQTITAMAIERSATITNEEFKELNLCLDEAIAEAVTEFGRQRELSATAASNARANEDLGILAHELRNLLATATLATDALRSGSVGISGSTGALLVRSLDGMRDLVDRSLSVVRLKAGVGAQQRVVIGELIEEVEVTAILVAKERGHHLTVERGDRGAVVLADRPILASVISNLVQNAFKYTRPNSHVILRSSTIADRVRIEVEDECGGLPGGTAAALFAPFIKGSGDQSGLGLGLAICQRGVEAIGGTIDVRDLPGKGCVFAVELPLAQA
jgi:signal transduction histidine kinase